MELNLTSFSHSEISLCSLCIVPSFSYLHVFAHTFSPLNTPPMSVVPKHMCTTYYKHILPLKLYPPQNNLQCILYFKLSICRSFPPLPSASAISSNSHCSYPTLKFLSLNSLWLHISLIFNCLLFVLYLPTKF